jgi:uncharacterized protein YjiS (DUF1127 family)
MSTLAARLAAARRRPIGFSPAHLVAFGCDTATRRLYARWRGWRRDRKSRAELARMSMRDLRDIGITPAERDRECERPFFRS